MGRSIAKTAIWATEILALACLLSGCAPQSENVPTPTSGFLPGSGLLVRVSPLEAGPGAGDSVVRVVYFYAQDCPHCIRVNDQVMTPLEEQYGDRLQIERIEISNPHGYALLLRAEEAFGASGWNIPVLLIDGQALIGEEAIRQQFSCLLEMCLAQGGTAWPDIPGLEEALGGEGGDVVREEARSCGSQEMTVCAVPEAVWAIYFYQVGCQDCSRAEYDIRYVQSQYPQLQIEERNIVEGDNVALARWLAERAGRRPEEMHTPALFIGDEALIGEEEISPQSVTALVERYAATGAEKGWEDFEPGGERLALDWLKVVLAGLIDGLNPCAFATLIFLVAYLAASERGGWEILAVGAAFAAGVFLAYLAIGVGLYRVLDLVRREHAILGRVFSWVTILLCVVWAVLSVADFFKARCGKVEDMALVLPEGLRRRIHGIIRRASRMRAFVLAAFVTGLVVSLLELACTGQIYWATLVSIAGDSLARAMPLLLLYNLMFIMPLVGVFSLVYLGTTSQQLGLFLRRHTATVKLATALLFAALAVWLMMEVVA